jgi:hypothetical protein
VDQRQNKRYRLKAAVLFSWKHPDGSTSQGEGYTRDISPSGVFVLTSDRLPLGTTVKLEVALPSLRKEPSGASLRTRGHVVRSEDLGFAAIAEMGFQMRFPETLSSEQSSGKANGGGGGKGVASGKETNRKEKSGKQLDLVSRTYWS